MCIKGPYLHKIHSKDHLKCQVDVISAKYSARLIYHYDFMLRTHKETDNKADCDNALYYPP